MADNPVTDAADAAAPKTDDAPPAVDDAVEPPKSDPPAPPKSEDRPGWVDDLMGKLDEVIGAVAAPANGDVIPGEPPPDDSPGGVPWTHRGFGGKR